MDASDKLGQRLCQALGVKEPMFTVPGRCWIFQMDCVEGMRKLKESGVLAGQVQNVVTSPPYNIGKEYERDNVLEWQSYVNWSGQWMSAAYDLVTPNGSMWLNVGYMDIPHKGRAVPIPYLIWDCSKFFLQQEVMHSLSYHITCL